MERGRCRGSGAGSGELGRRGVDGHARDSGRFRERRRGRRASRRHAVLMISVRRAGTAQGLGPGAAVAQTACRRARKSTGSTWRAPPQPVPHSQPGSADRSPPRSTSSRSSRANASSSAPQPKRDTARFLQRGRGPRTHPPATHPLGTGRADRVDPASDRTVDAPDRPARRDAQDLRISEHTIHVRCRQHLSDTATSQAAGEDALVTRAARGRTGDHLPPEQESRCARCGNSAFQRSFGRLAGRERHMAS